MKLLPHNYATHMDILLSRLRKQAAERRAAEANARTPWQRTPPMTLEARMAGYLDQNFPPRAAPTPAQLKRLMRKASILDPAVVLAAWEDARGESQARYWERVHRAGLDQAGLDQAGRVIYEEVTWDEVAGVAG